LELDVPELGSSLPVARLGLQFERQYYAHVRLLCLISLLFQEKHMLQL
jgi:hypothetical protein